MTDNDFDYSLRDDYRWAGFDEALRALGTALGDLDASGTLRMTREGYDPITLVVGPVAGRVSIAPVSTAECKAMSLYVHPEEHRALQVARVNDGVPANVRIRALIAMWQHNPEFRQAVDEVARRHRDD